MFRTTSRKDRAAEQVRDNAATIKKKAGPAADQAREGAVHAAEVAKEWASPRVGTARDWAAPRLEKAKDRGVEAAAPRVEAAAEALTPKVDAARDKIVDDLLPRLVESLTAAAAAAAAKTEAAASSTTSAIEEVSGVAQKKRRRRRRFLLLTVLTAAAGAGWAVWKRSQPSDDPWAAGTGTQSPSYTATGDRLSGGTTAGGLGTGTLASDSTDVDTPAPDGSTTAPADEALAGGGASSRLDANGTAEVPGVPSDHTEDGTDDDAKAAKGKHSSK